MVTTEAFEIRTFRPDDAEQLLRLMQQLAEFEGYLDKLTVKETDLIAHGTGPSPKFQAFVAHLEDSSTLIGMAVTYLIPWTYDLKPTLVLKELFVDEHWRGRTVGLSLMKAVAKHGVSEGAGRLQWNVLPSNSKAERFYRSLGGIRDPDWDPWCMSAGDLLSLSGR